MNHNKKYDSIQLSINSAHIYIGISKNISKIIFSNSI